ncbi:response regulator [Patescibacteria group bacterium]|nr:response regulator [Patescibacteria group bacterium]
MNVQELTSVIQRLLPASRPQTPALTRNGDTAAIGGLAPIIFVVDDDTNVRDAIRSVLEDEGWTAEDFGTCESFLESYRAGGEACLLVDAYLPGMSGLELLSRLQQPGYRLPAIMMTGDSDVQIAVQAMKVGASDFSVPDRPFTKLLIPPRDYTSITWKGKMAGVSPGLHGTAKLRTIGDFLRYGTTWDRPRQVVGGEGFLHIKLNLLGYFLFSAADPQISPQLNVEHALDFDFPISGQHIERQDRPRPIIDVLWPSGFAGSHFAVLRGGGA